MSATSMNLSEFQAFHDQALSAGVVFYQKGEFTSPVIAGAAEALKGRLQESGVSGPITRKLFSTFVEMAQNIHHYAAPEPDSGVQPPVGAGTITIVKSGNDYAVICVNRIDADQIPRISEKLDQVRSMSLEEIKKAYREQLHNNAHSEEDALSKGAGLGWLTVARDARQPLDYSFTTDPAGDGKFSFFSVKAVI
ncbi:SiaB family protein kinase [Rhodoferax sp. OV413]|uniref:SiaB family protein kinase n=1 Tax=Rhodoferax sp. OV413 TaxID=1855285 RepID=UPI0025CF2D4D|nr:SiaB family protein kinase [Rhodoferax sp. OV413]